MVVTGDRDAFQIIDPDSRVRVMATGRGITDTKVYDHAAVVERYGITPDLIPDFYGLKGDTSDNIPGVPGIGDKTASQLLQQFGSLESVLDHIDDISGAKRKQNLTEHSDDARVSKVLATIKRDVPVEVDPIAEAARPPDRSKLREVFREFELRDPLQRLEEAFGDDDAAAPAPVAEHDDLGARARGRRSPTSPRSASTPRSRVAVRAPAPPEGELFAETERGGSRSRPATACWSAPCDGPEDVVARARRPPGRSPTTRRRCASCRRTSSTTRCSPPTCSSPPAAGSRSARSARSAGWRATSPTRSAPRRCSTEALAAWQREQLDDRGLTRLMAEIELPLVRVLRDMEIAGVRLNKERLAEVDARVREEIDSSSARSGPRGRGVRDRLAAAARRRSCSRSSACRASAAARPASPPTPASCRRSATSTRSSPRSSAGASSTRSRRPTSTSCRSSPTPRAASTRRSCRRPRRRAGWLDEPEHAERPGPHGARAARSATASRPRRATCCSRPTTRRSSCACSPSSPTSRCSRRSSCAARTSTPRPRRRSSPSRPSELTPGTLEVEDDQLRDRLRAQRLRPRRPAHIPREEAKAFIDAYLERFPRVRRSWRTTIKQATEHGLRHDALRPPPADPRAPGAQLGRADARRAARRQHGHPGHRGGRHEARDDPRPRGARAPRASTTRHDPHDPRRAALRGPAGARWTRSARSPRREMVAPWGTATRRSRSTPASGGPGSTRSRRAASPGPAAPRGRYGS